MMGLRVTAFAVLGGLSLMAGAASAQESSLINTSSVVGQNYGFPTGTPDQNVGATGTTDFVLELAVFMKNHELLNLGAIEGETFFGVLVPARFRFEPSDRTTIEVGAVFGQNFGDNDLLDEISPIIRLVHQPREDMFVIGGTLVQTHWIHTGLFDDVWKFREISEQGLQWRVDNDGWKQDLWVNWRIREGSVNAEEFEIGNATQLRFFDDRVRADVQFHWTHAGGQISTSPRVENNFVAMFGGSIGFAEDIGSDWIEDLRVGAAGFYSTDDTKQTNQVTGNGFEVFATLDIAAPGNGLYRFDARYFSGEDFLPRRGDPLYTLDDYGQLGATGVWSVGDNVQLEVGAVAQFTDDQLNYTAQINLVWGTAFIANYLNPR